MQQCCSANVISYDASISACEKGHQWQQAFGVLAGMQQTAMLRNVISYKAAISACVKGPMQSELFEL